MNYAELVVFDDDGPEGFYERTEHQSSRLAAQYFMDKYGCYGDNYHCSINQINTGKAE